MTELANIIYLFLIFPVFFFIPGYLITRRTALPKVLVLVNSISLSALIVFAVSFVFYIFKFKAGCHVFFSLSLVAAAVLLRKELFEFINSSPIKTLLMHYGIFVAWVFILTMAIRHYSGGGWGGDWEEHYRRSLFFRDFYPLDTIFLGKWHLTARPPLYNLLASFFLKQSGNDFFYYQATSVLLNTLVFFGACSLLFAFTNGKKNGAPAAIALLTLLLCLNPSVMMNVTYTWTKALANFFVLCSLGLFYKAAMESKEDDNTLRWFSYLNMGLAVVTHYSAVPYLIGLVMIDLYFLSRGRLSVKNWATNAGTFLAMISIWFAFAIFHYGAGVTFASNSTVIDSSSMGFWGNLVKIANNTINTIVPHFLRPIPGAVYQKENSVGYIRDYAFLVYQVNMLFMMGSVGWAVALSTFVKRSAVSFIKGAAERPLLIWFFLVSVIAMGIAVHGSYDLFGVGHICLQPLAILGVVYLSANFPEYGRFVRTLLWIGIFVDLIFGVLLQFWMQHFDAGDIAKGSRNMFSVGSTVTRGAIRKAESGCVFLADLNYAAFLTAAFVFALFFLLIWSCRSKVDDAHV